GAAGWCRAAGTVLPRLGCGGWGEVVGEPVGAQFVGGGGEVVQGEGVAGGVHSGGGPAGAAPAVLVQQAAHVGGGGEGDADAAPGLAGVAEGELLAGQAGEDDESGDEGAAAFVDAGQCGFGGVHAGFDLFAGVAGGVGV